MGGSTPSPDQTAAAALVRRHLADPTSAWSIGTYGAIGEFLRDSNEPVVANLDAGVLEVTTGRGALRVTPCPEVTLIAYESPTRRPDGWAQGIAFALPVSAIPGSAHTGLAEIGRDEDAVRAQDRTATLFDLGLAARHVTVCVRSADRALVRALRSARTQDILTPGHPALRAIMELQPHRVFQSPMGRLEVYQEIASAEPGATTPEGPHTHVLPALLKHARTHSPDVPIPRGFAPGLTLHPASPISDANGDPIAFDRGRHEAFQALLELHADGAYVREKARVISAVTSRVKPAEYAPPEAPLECTALRVALRQLEWTRPGLSGLSEWRAVFDPQSAPGG